MKPQWRRFAPWGLYLALAAALVSLGLYIVQRQWNLALQISLGVILLGIALFALLDPMRARQALTGRQARHGSNALVLTLAFVGILVVVNYLAYKNSQRWDLTEGKENTLAVETLDTLATLPEAVEAQAFFTSRLSPENAKNLLEQYQFAAKGKLSYRFIDPEADPVAAQNAKITRDGTVVLVMGGRQELVEFVNEKEITSALVRLINVQSKMVYFLTGHGERDISGQNEDAYGMVKQVLESKNYQVEAINLLSVNAIPEDANVLVIPGPRKPLTEGEVALLTGYLERGGALIVMEEPLPTTEFGDQADPLAAYLAQTWGVVLGSDIVVDLSSQQPFLAVASQYGAHAITEKLSGMVTFFPTARSVKSAPTAAGVAPLGLVYTGDQAWGETDFAALEGGGGPQAAPDEGADLIGNVPLAALVDDAASGSRLVVFGDADFATNAYFAQYGNGDLFINSVDWAAGQEDLISLTPKDEVQRVLAPPQRYSIGLILLGSVFLLPGSVLAAGVIVWYQRRKRG
ncbi:MAG: GldG family protein [Chloroflexi bacterium]|nr:GldG family protein [Chloroflexota bacterium]